MLRKDLPLGVITDDPGVKEASQIQLLRAELSHLAGRLG